MGGKLDIINSALRKIGAKKAVSLEDNNPDLRLILAVYNDMRDDMLSRFSWGFATKFVTLAKELNPPVWGFTNAYTLPTDCVLVVSVQATPDITEYPTEYEVVGASIFTDAQPVYLRYVSNAVDENKWPIYFREALSLRIAYEVCLQSSKVPNLYETLVKMFAAEYERAIYLDKRNSKEAVKNDEDPNEFLDIRE